MLDRTTLLRFNFLIVLAATLGSLFFSEVLGYPPCVLCWYQRIFIYPLTVIFMVALWTDDPDYYKYSLPLILTGLGFAIYHNLLYYGIIAPTITPCTKGVSCTERQIELFGFITIPLMSLLCFLVLTVTGFAAKGSRTK